MTEPWERVKMALCEAGRPDLAAIVHAPVGDWRFMTTPGWVASAPAEDLAIVRKARLLAFPDRPPTECLDCWRARAGSPGPPTCTHT